MFRQASIWGRQAAQEPSHIAEDLSFINKMLKRLFAHLHKNEWGFIVHKNASIVPKSDISIDKRKLIIYEYYKMIFLRIIFSAVSEWKGVIR